MRMRLLLICALGFGMFVTASASADVVYSTYGPGDSYDYGAGQTISGSSFIGYAATGLEFSPTSDGNLASIDFSIGFITGTNAITLSLYASNGFTTGTLLEHWSVTDLPNFGDNVSPLTVTSTSHSHLVVGTNYFLVASPGASNTGGGWYYNSIGATGSVYHSFASPGTNGGTQTDTLPAVRVNATGASVPEPTTFAMLSIAGLVLLGVRMKRARRVLNRALSYVHNHDQLTSTSVSVSELTDQRSAFQ